MSDVFDDDLMKELGLDPSEFQEGVVAKTQPKSGAGTQPGMPKPQVPPTGVAKPAPAMPRPQASAPQPKQTATVPPRAPAPLPKSIKDAPPVPPQSQAKKISNEIPVQMAAVLAKKTMRLSEILTLNVGEVLEFKKQPNEPLDLVANGKLVAKAELVVVDGKLGVRIVKLVR